MRWRYDNPPLPCTRIVLLEHWRRHVIAHWNGRQWRERNTTVFVECWWDADLPEIPQ